jgi:hypothetical protein
MSADPRTAEELVAAARSFRDVMAASDLEVPGPGSMIGLWLATADALAEAPAAPEILTRHGVQAARSFNPSPTWCADEAEALATAEKRRAAGMATLVVWQRYVMVDGGLFAGPVFVS